MSKREPGWKSLLVDLSILPVLQAPLLLLLPLCMDDDDIDDAELLENPLPARPTHLKRGGGGPDMRRPSGPKDDVVFFVVNIRTLPS